MTDSDWLFYFVNFVLIEPELTNMNNKVKVSIKGQSDKMNTTHMTIKFEVQIPYLMLPTNGQTPGQQLLRVHRSLQFARVFHV